MMMTLERARDTNNTKRPETSKFSRSSQRSQFNMTMNNFNINSSGNSKVQSRKEKKPETQINFYKVANQTSAFQSKENNIAPKQTYNPKKKVLTQASFPDVHTNEATDDLSSSMGFSLQPSELKNGMTLDKVLGGGFKKISIFDANLAEFSDKDTTIEEPVRKKTNRLSTSIDDEEYKNFEIVETENEEDAHYESRGHVKQPRKSQETENDERTTLPDNNQILDRIQKKYKTRKTKTIYRRKSKILSKAEVSVEQIDTDGTEQEQRNEDPYNNQEDRGRESILSKNESKSLSPKMANEMKRNRFQSLASDKQKFGVSNTKYTMPNEIFYGLKRVPYDVQNDSKSQTQNKFRISSNKFKSTKENLKTESDDTKNLNNKKPLQIKALLNDFNHVNEFIRERKTEQEYERETSRSGSVANTEKFLENTRRGPSEKINKYIIEQKLSRENRLINDKIKKTEQEIMQKYSKMFHFNNDEKIYLLKNNTKIDEGGRRLSTPMKDIDPSRYMPRKFINS